jgi:hypothetical protein
MVRLGFLRLSKGSDPVIDVSCALSIPKPEEEPRETLPGLLKTAHLFVLSQAEKAKFEAFQARKPEMV